jgi:hypothetical protein
MDIRSFSRLKDFPYMSARLSLRKLLGCAAALSFLCLSGCHHSNEIRDLAQHPDSYRDRDVRIHGRVVASYSLHAITNKSFYVVSDGTGQIGVYTAAAAPDQNSEVTVTGHVEDVPAIGLPAVKQFKLAEVMLKEKEIEIAKR